MSTFSRVANLTPAAFLRHQRRRLHRSTQRIGGRLLGTVAVSEHRLLEPASAMD